nr:hypothetical protein [Tanacetum cinerariifolium]
MDFVRYVIQEIHAFTILIRIPSIALPTLATLHTPHTRLARVIQVETILILVMIVHLRSLIVIPFSKRHIASLDRVFEIKDAFGNKQYKPEDMQELFRKLLNDVQNIHEELAEYINTPGWNPRASQKVEPSDLIHLLVDSVGGSCVASLYFTRPKQCPKSHKYPAACEPSGMFNDTSPSTGRFGTSMSALRHLFLSPRPGIVLRFRKNYKSYASVMSIPLWTLQSTQEDVDVHEFYGENNALFSLKVHYAGMFTNPPNMSYVNSDISLFDCIDIDEFLVIEVSNMVNKLEMTDVLELREYVILGSRVIEVYVEHHSSTLDTYYQSHQVIDISTLKNSCIIEEADDVIPAKRPNMLQPIKFGKSACARNLLGWNDIRDKLGIAINVEIESLDDAEEEEDSDGFVDVENPMEEIKMVLERIRNRKLKQLRKQGKPKDGFMANIVFFVRKEFASADDVKKNIHKLSIETRRELFLKKNDKVRVRAECRVTIPMFKDTPQHGPSGGGPSQASGSRPKTKWTKVKVSESKVKTFNDTCKCLQSRKIKYCTADFLSTDIRQHIETNSEIPIKALQEQLQKKFQLEVSRMKAFRAKLQVVDSVRGDYTLQYKMLRDYVMKLKECNPNTRMRIGVETKKDHTSLARIFKRIYVCLGASKAGFKASRREFLGLDRAFLKGPFIGQLLTVMGIDPNNGIYPLAYRIVETESRDSWTWFLEHLKDYLDLQENFNFTFISDMQKLALIPPQHWAKAYFSGRAKTDMLLNNMYEVFNGQLLDGRDRLIIISLEYAKNHRINPIKGKIIWLKSNIPITILTLNHHPQARRPPKKRKRSASPQVPKVNKITTATRRGASAITVKASASGSKTATQKGNKSFASVKVATSGSNAPQKGNKTAGNVKGAATGPRQLLKKEKNCCGKWKRIKPGYSTIWECT